jgi:hypothetical protein
MGVGEVLFMLRSPAVGGGQNPYKSGDDKWRRKLASKSGDDLWCRVLAADCGEC